MIAPGGEIMAKGEERIHEPVLLRQVLETLAPEPLTLDGWFVDATLGAAGHAKALLERCPRASLLGIDQDPELVAIAGERLQGFAGRFQVVRARHSNLAKVVAEAGISRPLGVLLDLGVNSMHLDRAERGFSFQSDGPLDMRMDPSRDRTAAEIVNSWDESDLADLFFHEGGERQSRKIAHAICAARRRVPFQRTAALADLIANTAGRGRGRIHPATRTFQALRRAVNEEGEELLRALGAAQDVLADGARLVVVTFHSGEDKAVKRWFREHARGGFWRLETRKPLGPDPTERRANPRARSAFMRYAVRTRGAADSPVQRDSGGGY